MSNILSYTDSGNVHITNENISELMIAADNLKVDGIFTEIKIFINNNLSINNCIPILVAASKIKEDDFVKEIYKFVQSNFERVIHNERISIVDLPLEAFEKLLSDRNLCISSEMTIFKSIVQWVSFDSSKRLAIVPNLIKYLMLSAIDEDSATDILQHDIVKKNTFFQNINDVKSSFSSSLEVIKYYSQSLPRPESLPIKRIPPKLNCVLYEDRNFGYHTRELYITYNEQLDLWRKVSDIKYYDKLFYTDGFIYRFSTRDTGDFCRYSIVDRQMHNMSAFITDREHYVVVNLEGNIYVLGGCSSDTGDHLYSVEIYDPGLDVWSPTASMFPIAYFVAAPLNNRIYVLGVNVTYDEMIAQVFDATTETWSLLPPVPTNRSEEFEIVSYLEKIYVIGGERGTEKLKVVDVFDPAKNEWRNETGDIPYVYSYPTAIVFQDLLIVFDAANPNYSRNNPPVFYNNKENRWECFEESSPFRKIHKFQFFTIDKEEYIDILTRESRNSDIHFEKSPFA